MRKNTAFYKDYTTTDFILDPDFIAWCKNLPDADEAFWLKFREQYPEQKEAMKTASLFLVNLRIDKSSPSAITIQKVWERVEYANHKYAKTQTPFTKSTLFKIAAFFVFLVAGVVIYTLLNQKQATTTSYGEIRRIELPDHSIVVLNARSVLKYDKDWHNKNNREVFLAGEAYFEVSKDRQHPFIVHTPDGTRIEVVGTHFNVKAYDNDKTTQTTVLEGAVKVTKGHTTNLLTPGEKAIVPKIEESVKVLNKVNEANTIAWKEGQFSFDNSDIYDVMDQVARWYNVKVQYEGKVSGSLNGNLNKTLPLTDIIRILELAGNIKIKKDHITLIVSQAN